MPQQRGSDGDRGRTGKSGAPTGRSTEDKNRLGRARAYTPRGRTVREQSSLRVVPPIDQSEEESIRESRTRHAGRSRPKVHDRAEKPGGRAEKPGARAEKPGGRASKGGMSRPRRPKAVKVPKPPRPANPQRRLRLAAGLALLMFTAVGVRLIELQFEGAPAAAAQGLESRLEHRTLYASRGSILDRNGAIMVHSLEARLVYADPTLIKDPAGAAAKLAPLLGRPVSELLPLLAPHNQPNTTNPQRYEVLGRDVSIETGDAVKAMKIDGVAVDRSERRDVLSQDVAANLIGFTNEDGGLVGLEARFDELLAGKNGLSTYEVGQGDQLDKEIPGGYHKTVPARNGSTLQLTIDRDLQYEVQRILTAKMQQVKATFGSATVIDVKTGEVVAQASWPTYNAANPLASQPSDRGDVASNELVDPGSVHKAIVLAGALEEGVITPDSTVTVAPTIKVADKTYEDTHKFASGTKITMPALMAYSSNVGTIKISQQLGAENLYKYQRLFGLGQPTGISIPGEASGVARPPSEWQGSDFGSIPIGNGVSVTPLQMTAAYAAIANDGVYIQPHLVKNIIGPDGKVRPAETPASHRVISAEHAAQLRLIMEPVTTAVGATARSAAIPGYRVAGKTGTGRYYATNGYGKGEVASFIGMAPAESPRYVIGVFAYTPGGNGGVVCGPAFKDMMSFALKHFGVAPSGEKPPTFVATR